MKVTPEVETLVHRLVDLTESQQQQYFDEHPTDSETRQQVEALLAGAATSRVDVKSGVSLQAESNSIGTESAAEGSLCGPYRLLKLIGQGGMGEVWLAERQDGLLKRAVALKLPYSGRKATHFAERLHRERDILASLVHPGIARLYDAGVAEGNRPFLALEFVEGRDLASYCNERQLSVRERLTLFLQVLNAVQYAHSRLVIHRDLKPSNILVTDDGEVKLLDFGIAKLMVEGEALETELTQVGGRALTLHFASPEQISGQPVTTASDVFSLGVILFELISGERPFVPKRDTLSALEEAILTMDPKRPSQAVANELHARERSTSVRKLKSFLRNDLDLIVLKALQKIPEDRYSTADAFRADIERHLGGEAVLAQPESARYRLKKFVLRHSLGVVATLAVFLALAAGLGVALWQARVAQAEARTSAAVEEFTEDIFRTNSLERDDPVKARQTTARELLDIGARKISLSLKQAPDAKLRMLEILGALYQDLGLDDQAVALQKQRLALAKRLSGARSTALVPPLIDLGSALHASRSVKEREGVLLEAKAILDQDRDFNSPTRARLMSVLSEHYASTDLPKSVAFARESVQIYRKWPASAAYAGALYLEGVSLSTTGDYAGAAEALREAIPVSKKFSGDPNPNLARDYAYLAESDYELMQYGSAEESYLMAVKYARALGGEDAVDTLETESRLGMFFVLTSRSRQGLPYLEKTKDICLRTKGPDDPFYTPQMLLQYGMALEANGRPEEALENITQALENRRKNRPGTRYLAQMEEDQAVVLVEFGRYREAEAALQDALTIRQKVGQKMNSNHVIPQLRLDFELARLPEASELIESYFGALPETAPVSQTLLQALDARTELALRRNNGEAAVALADKSLNAIDSSPAKPYFKNQKTRALLNKGRGYLLQRDPAKALPFLEASVTAALEMFDSNSPRISVAQANLGICYLELGNVTEARELLSRSLLILHSHKNLAESYRKPTLELSRRLTFAAPKDR